MFLKAKISYDRKNGNHLPISFLIENILKSSTKINLFHDKYEKWNVNKSYNKHSWIILLYKKH